MTPDTTKPGTASEKLLAEYRNRMKCVDTGGTQAGATSAYAIALDIRKFEIDLYWKRAAYFWAFAGAALAAHLAALTGKELENRAEALMVTSCIGLLFAVAWYFVNRASKYWQLNWEFHVDLLEDEKVGKLYKTVLEAESRLWNPSAAYPFSVSKINQWLSLFVAFAFAGLVANTGSRYYFFGIGSGIDWFATLCLLLTTSAIGIMTIFGRVSGMDAKVFMRTRTTTLAERISPLTPTDPAPPPAQSPTAR